ncbi:hypothetical protein [Thioalkalivibrio thiocyanodenitrificans]|uniref:hypothetical protein n=1 Tax=Thioalkalivibrio thiocyanodenitrificans TaxID=243063 RepID=UPI00037EA328|nr:hypothetical protein [Thioalkalivibrio thiocyanodenitrificans]
MNEFVDRLGNPERGNCSITAIELDPDNPAGGDVKVFYRKERRGKVEQSLAPAHMVTIGCARLWRYFGQRYPNCELPALDEEARARRLSLMLDYLNPMLRQFGLDEARAVSSDDMEFGEYGGIDLGSGYYLELGPLPLTVRVGPEGENRAVDLPAWVFTGSLHNPGVYRYPDGSGEPPSDEPYEINCFPAEGHEAQAVQAVLRHLMGEKIEAYSASLLEEEDYFRSLLFGDREERDADIIVRLEKEAEDVLEGRRKPPFGRDLDEHVRLCQERIESLKQVIERCV